MCTTKWAWPRNKATYFVPLLFHHTQFYLKQCLAHAREDLMRLRQLQCPHLVTAISVSFCPPSLALECAPLGSLRNVLKRNQKTIGQDIIHQIALQVRLGCLSEHDTLTSTTEVSLITAVRTEGQVLTLQDPQLPIYLDQLL